MIKADSISFIYPGANAPVFTNFSACFNRGEITAVRGLSGSGKTTLTKLLTGILRPSSGKITIDGQNTKGMGLFEIGRRAGYIFQNPDRQLFCGTVYDEVAFGLRNLGFSEEEARKKADYFLEYFAIGRYRDVYPGKLSFGERRRLTLAAVCALGTDYLILDEPAAGLDANNRDELTKLLLRVKSDSNCGIIIVSHDNAFLAKLADREQVIR